MCRKLSLVSVTDILTTKQVCPANNTEVVRYGWLAVSMLITLD